MPADDRVVVTVSPDTRLIVPLGDGYWTKLLNKHYVYEPEMAIFLDKYVNSDSYFLDCGANIGYWTLLYRNRARKVVALEANPLTFARLEDNISLNHAQVTPVHAALWSEDGQQLSVRQEARQHAGAFVSPELLTLRPAKENLTALVRSVTLQTLIEEHCSDVDLQVIIKLDVEGAEIPALRGGRDLLRRRRVLIAYEDHGDDPTCKVSRHLQAQGMVTADLVTGLPLSIDEIAARKTSAWKGYNFLAYFRV